MLKHSLSYAKSGLEQRWHNVAHIHKGDDIPSLVKTKPLISSSFCLEHVGVGCSEQMTMQAFGSSFQI